MNYNGREKALIWLAVQEIASGKKLKLQSLCDIYGLWRRIDAYRDNVISIVGEEHYKILKSTASAEAADKFISEMDKAGIRAITLESELYPSCLKEIHNPPLTLFAKGRIELLESRCFAVVGTREPTRYGREVTESFVRELVEKGFTIVSGMARGIDTVAHKVALAAGKPAIGVLGSGLDKVYPADNRALFQEVVEKGLLISEYKLGTGVQQYYFPERNRIISGISEAVLVPEAGVNSGSLITVNHAFDQGRNVYIVPGNIYSKASMGANERLKMCQGAITTCVNDIFIDMNIAPNVEIKSEMQLDFIEAQILSALEKEELHIERLIELTGLSIVQLSPLLSRLELLGIIKKLYGNYYGV